MRISSQSIKYHLKRLEKQRYQIRFPGGTSRDGESASFGVAYLEWNEGPILLMMPYNGSVKSETEIPEQVFAEHPKGVLEREFIEETLARALLYEEIGKNPIPHRDDVNKMHIQTAYVITAIDDSSIREISSPSDKLGPPLWVPLALVREKLYNNHLWILDAFSSWYMTDKRVFRKKTFNQGVYA